MNFGLSMANVKSVGNILKTFKFDSISEESLFWNCEKVKHQFYNIARNVRAVFPCTRVHQYNSSYKVIMWLFAVSFLFSTMIWHLLIVLLWPSLIQWASFCPWVLTIEGIRVRYSSPSTENRLRLLRSIVYWCRLIVHLSRIVHIIITCVSIISVNRLKGFLHLLILVCVVSETFPWNSNHFASPF